MKKRFLVLLTPLLSAFITSCDSSKISEQISEKASDIVPNLWITLAQLGAFLVTVFVFFKLFYKPLKNKINARKDYIEKNIHESERLNKEAKDNNDLSLVNIQKSQIEASNIIEQAKNTASNEASRIISEANNQIEQNKLQAQEEITHDRQLMEKEIHNKIISYSLDASKEIIGRELTKKDNDKIIEDFISNIEG